MSKRITVIVGGPSPEHDVSILTGLQAARALSGAGNDVTVLYWSKQGRWSLHASSLEATAFADGPPTGGREAEWEIGADPGLVTKGRLGRSAKVLIDLALVACHGAPGEDGTLQSLLELAGIPYSGPNAREAALSMDKLAFAGFAASLGLPVARRIVLNGTTALTETFDGPFVLKPRFGGSSLGVELVDTLEDATTFIRSKSLYAAGAYVEELKEGWFDINVAIRSYPTLELSQFERPIGKGVGALSYEDKYVAREGMAGAARELPAKIDPGLQEQMSAAALLIGAALPVRGVMRLDFMTDGTSFIVNEINAIPGSWSKYLWGDQGEASFRELLGHLVDEAQRRPVGRWTSDGADGRLLRDAHSIASKLA